MNPIEMILAQLTGGGAQPAGAFSPPQLPQPPMPRAAGDVTRGSLGATSPDAGAESTGSSIFEDGNNAPHMILRRLLTGSNEPPVESPLPDLSLLSKSQLAAAGPKPPAAMPPGVSLGSMPSPSTDPSLKAMFSEGQQMPTASTMPPRQPMPQRQPMPAQAPRAVQPPMPPQTAAAPAPAPAAAAPPDGLAGMLANIQKNPTANLIRDLLTSTMAGAATAQGPRAGNIGALGVGYTTAEQQMQARQRQQAAADLAKQKMAFDQTLAVRKDTRDERGANREDEKLGLSKEDQKRKAEESKVKNQVSVEKLMKVRDDGTLPLAAKMKIQDQLNQYADKVNKNGLMTQAELDGALTKERDRLEQYYGLRKPAASATPDGATPVTRQARGPDGKVVTFTLQNGQWVPQQ